MLSYLNDPAVKEKFQLRFAAHRAADEVIQGTGFENGRGCFVGCTLDNYDHAQFPKQLGWPEWLAHLADSIFEGIPKADAAQFGTDLLAAVPVGVDLEPVRFIIAINRHTLQLEALKDNKKPYAEQCRKALRGVIKYCQGKIDKNNDPAARSAAESAARSAAESAAESAARSAAESAAESAARSAARSAAWSAAESAAESAAWSAAESARSAAESAAWSAAESAAESAAWVNEKDFLLNVLKSLGN